MPFDVTINIHPVNFVIVSGIVQSVVLAAILFFRKGNSTANRLIALFVLLCSLHFSWSMVIDLNLGTLFPKLFWFPYSYLLLLGPLLFFYTRARCEPDFWFNVKDLIHFVPVSMEVIVQVIFIIQGAHQYTVPYEVAGFLFFRAVEFTAAVISILMYGKRSLALIKAHEVAIRHNFSSQLNVTLAWLLKLISYLQMLWLFWLMFELSFIAFLQFHMHYLAMYLLLYVLLGIITYSNYWVALQALFKSETLVEKTSLSASPENKNVYARLTDNDLKAYADKLDQVMQKEKLEAIKNIWGSNAIVALIKTRGDSVKALGVSQAELEEKVYAQIVKKYGKGG